MPNEVNVDVVSETMNIILGSTSIPIGVEVAQGVARLADQRSACQSIVALADLEDRLKALKSDERNLQKLVDHEVMDSDSVGVAQDNINHQRAVTSSEIDKVKPIMSRSTAFNVPVSSGTTITPSAFVQGSGKLRRDTVKAAQTMLASL